MRNDYLKNCILIQVLALRNKLKNETMEAKMNRLKKQADYQAKKRSAESPEQSTKRKAKEAAKARENIKKKLRLILIQFSKEIPKLGNH